MRTRRDLYKNVQCGYLRQFYLTTAKALGFIAILFSWHINIIELDMTVYYELSNYEAKGIHIQYSFSVLIVGRNQKLPQQHHNLLHISIYNRKILQTPLEV